MAPYLALVLFLVLCISGGLWGADSRPGFNGRIDDRKERLHSKID